MHSRLVDFIHLRTLLFFLFIFFKVCLARHEIEVPVFINILVFRLKVVGTVKNLSCVFSFLEVIFLPNHPGLLWSILGGFYSLCFSLYASSIGLYMIYKQCNSMQHIAHSTQQDDDRVHSCLLYTSPSPRDS